MTPAAPDVDELLLRLGQGDLLALGELFVRYREALKKIVEFRLDCRLRGRIDASDVVQDVYIDAAQRVRHYLAKPAMPFFVWLRLLAKQRLIDIHRHHVECEKRDAGREVSLGSPGNSDRSSMCMAACLAGREPSPSAAAGNAELAARLEAALDRMDPVDREVLALRHFEELGNNEVAAILGLKKAAASNRYVRAMQRLREILEGMPELGQGA